MSVRLTQSRTVSAIFFAQERAESDALIARYTKQKANMAVQSVHFTPQIMTNCSKEGDSGMKKFHVGQKVRIVGNTHKIHGAIMPQICEIIRVEEGACSVLCKTIHGGNNKAVQTIYTCDLQPVGVKII